MKTMAECQIVFVVFRREETAAMPFDHMVTPEQAIRNQTGQCVNLKHNTRQIVNAI